MKTNVSVSYTHLPAVREHCRYTRETFIGKTMEKSNNRVLNELLVNLFHNVMDAEAKAVITEEFKDITNNDMHILEAIGIEEPKSMSLSLIHI